MHSELSPRLASHEICFPAIDSTIKIDERFTRKYTSVHRVWHWIVNTYFRIGDIRSAAFYLAPLDRAEIPRIRSEAKILYRGPRLVGTWLNWRSVAGIRSTIQRIEFLSQLSAHPSLFSSLPFICVFYIYKRLCFQSW